jgi:hypothetical protein
MWNDEQLRPAAPSVWDTRRPSLVPPVSVIVIGVGLVVLGVLTMLGPTGMAKVMGAGVLVAAAHLLGGEAWEQLVPGWVRGLAMWVGSAVAGVFVLWNLFPMVVDARSSGTIANQAASFTWATATAAERGAAMSIGMLLGLYARLSWLMLRAEDEPHVHDVFAVHLGGVWTQVWCRSRHNWFAWALVSMMTIVVVIWVAAWFGVIDLNESPY